MTQQPSNPAPPSPAWPLPPGPPDSWLPPVPMPPPPDWPPPVPLPAELSQSVSQPEAKARRRPSWRRRSLSDRPESEPRQTSHQEENTAPARDGCEKVQPVLAGPSRRAVGAAGYVSAGLPRKQRRAKARAARKIEADARQALMAERKAVLDAQRQERRRAAYLPRRGEPGPAALRSYRRLHTTPYRATSDVLAVAYPFLAEAGLGSDGVLIGHDSWSGAGFVFDPWVLYGKGVLTNPNVLLAGVIGRGKSTLAKSLTTRSLPLGRRVYVPGDPKGEWTPVVKANGGATIEVGTGNRLNPLDEGPRPTGMADDTWQQVVAQRRNDLLGALTEQSLGRPLRPTQRTAIAAAVDHVVEQTAGRGEPPILPLVVQAMLYPSADRRGSTARQLATDGREAAHALARLVDGDLGGLFDGPSTVAFDPSLPMVSIDLSHVASAGASDTMIALVMTCASAWMEAALFDPGAGLRWVVYDEAWRIMRSPALLSRMQAQWKLSRAHGIANMAIIHRLSDLGAVGDADSAARNTALGLLADCSNRVIYAQESGEAEKTGAAIGLSETEIAQLPQLERGEGLWRVGERAFMVRHRLTPAELELFNTDARMSMT